MGAEPRQTQRATHNQACTTACQGMSPTRLVFSGRMRTLSGAVLLHALVLLEISYQRADCGRTAAAPAEPVPAFQLLHPRRPCGFNTKCAQSVLKDLSVRGRQGSATNRRDVACSAEVPKSELKNSDGGSCSHIPRSDGIGASNVERRRAILQTGAALATLLTPVEQATADAVGKSQRKKQRTGQQEKKPRLEAEREGGRLVYDAIGGVRPAALVVLVGGFMIPAFQYDSYARALQGLGYSVLVFEDKSTIAEPRPLQQSARELLTQLKDTIQAHHQRALLLDRGPADHGHSMKLILRAEARGYRAVSSPASTGAPAWSQPAEAAEMTAEDQDPPVIFIGHSRGAKICNLAAAACPWEVAAMVFFDPVDSTSFEPQETLSTLRRLRVPTAVIGGGADPSGLCAPLDANYNAFFQAAASAASPRLLAEIGAAGHTQFLDVRGALLDPCTAGPVDDAAVREIALAVAASWISAWCPMVVSSLSAQEQAVWEKSRSFVNRDLAYVRLAEKASRADVREQLEQYRWQTPVKFTAAGGGL